MTEKEVVVKGLKINYKIFGSKGMPFLILHGWPSNSDRWIETGELLSRKGLMVIVPDLPGFGKSDTLKEAWCIDDYVEWVNEFVGLFPQFKEEFYILGHSFGGSIAVKFSINYAQRIKKLFLLGAAAVRKRTTKKQVLVSLSKLAKMFSFLPFYELVKKAVYKYVVRSYDYLKADDIMKKTFINCTQDLSQHLPFVKTPTVIIWGKKDDVTLIDEAYLINKKIENSKLEIIEEGDHNLEIDMPEELAKRVLNNLTTEVFASTDINL